MRQRHVRYTRNEKKHKSRAFFWFPMRKNNPSKGKKNKKTKRKPWRTTFLFYFSKKNILLNGFLYTQRIGMSDLIMKTFFFLFLGSRIQKEYYIIINACCCIMTWFIIWLSLKKKLDRPSFYFNFIFFSNSIMMDVWAFIPPPMYWITSRLIPLLRRKEIEWLPGIKGGVK